MSIGNETPMTECKERAWIEVHYPDQDLGGCGSILLTFQGRIAADHGLVGDAVDRLRVTERFKAE